MSDQQKKITVRHEPPAKRFAVRLDGNIGYLSYEFIDDTRVDVAHTYVPEAYRNRGIVAQITDTALRWAKDNGYTVVPSCSYVRAYVQRHREFDAIVDGS